MHLKANAGLFWGEFVRFSFSISLAHEPPSEEPDVGGFEVHPNALFAAVVS